MAHIKTLLLTLYISSATIELARATATVNQNHSSANVTIRRAEKITTPVPAPRLFEARHETPTSPTTIAASNATLNATLLPALNDTSKLQNDHRPEASLLRPSFIRGLLGSHKRPGGGSGAGRYKYKEANDDDDMEEVTQTIMVPIKQSEGGQTNGRSKSFGAGSGIQSQETSVPSRNHPKELSTTHPLAEASLQLTSTEIGGLLNDREAPEFYRERELNGDGILVGEEPVARPGDSSSSASSSLSSSPNSRLGMAASGPFGSQFMGDYGPSSGPGAGFDGGDNAAAIYRHRLAQAASEEGYSGGGGSFNHRFGHQSFGGGGADELGMAAAGGGNFGGGGLMQSPNEYSEVNSYNQGYGGGGNGFMGAQGQYPGSGGDYSPNSGLLRAGSEGSFGVGGSFGQGMGMGGGAGGPLEMAAAGYGGGGGGEFGSGPMGEFGGGQGAYYGGSGSGRLQAHASYNPYMAGPSEADYASRFGFNGAGMGANSFGMDQRGFASQNNHQIMSQRLHQAASSGGRSQGGRLMPLTPVVPMAEELAGAMQPSGLSSNQRDQVAQGPGQMTRTNQMMGSSHGSAMGRGSHQVHEALEDDPTDVSQADDNSGSEHNSDNSFDGPSGSFGPGAGSSEGIGNNAGNEMNGMVTSTMSSNQRDQFAGATKAAGYGPSFVLNVPPPSEQSGYMQRAQRGLSQQQMVEFSRVGSAGYLGPSMSPDSSASHQHGHSMLAKKFGDHHRSAAFGPSGQEEASDESDESGDESSSSAFSSSSGADNPAHAGKYIIDK